MSRFNPRKTPWLIDEAEFFKIDDPVAQKAFLLRYAVLAPSGHNSQPWAFRIDGDAIHVFADFSRRLPVADPDDRELLISVGAAIANLRVAAAHFGFDSTLHFVSDEATPRLLARVTLSETCAPDERLRALFPAITKRHTNRNEFEPREIEPEALDRLCSFVESCDSLRFVPPHERSAAAELVEAAERELMRDERWRAELAAWVRPNDSDQGDGMSGDAFGIPGPLASFAPWLIRKFDVGESRGRVDHDLVQNAAGLIVVTGDDDRESLLRAGETVESLLLLLTLLGIQYAFVNAPVEVRETRRELWTLMRSPKPPQLLIRIGYAPPVRLPMPRRPIDAVRV